ncbi:hypothetical protein H1P_850031 [Hyella patelloides LEGE 07179]|uniref:Uncharacterized protein n=1 Tax=Hyella patelloides LEGE 07179 TaxID=945734 RepID=A0A563W4R5_9CYAN|nr:hypothetical protein H1P_850031 [Hyella patelloides LEGE 07179]
MGISLSCIFLPAVSMYFSHDIFAHSEKQKNPTFYLFISFRFICEHHTSQYLRVV